MSNKLTVFALVTFLVLLFVSPVSASPALDSPVGPIQDITTDFEALPDYFGLGAVVALVIVVARMLKLPDGLGGYAALIVGIFAYAASELLPAASRDTLFEMLDHAARFLVVVLGSQTAHISMKYSRLDRLWKGGDGK